MDETENTEVTEKTEEKNSTGAKSLSKWSMLFTSLWICALTLLKGIGIVKGLTVIEIIYSGLAMTAVWTPTFLSIFMDKLKDIKIGKSE